MLERVLSRDTTIGIVYKHLLEQVETLRAQARYMNTQIFLLELREVRSVALQVLDAGPLIRRRCSHDLENLDELIFLVLAREQGLPGHNLSEDAANRPNVDRRVVVLRAHENVRSAIPQRHNLVRKVLDWDAEGASQTEIRQLKNVVFVDEQILRLQISVEHLVLVALGGAGQQLIQVRLKEND